MKINTTSRICGNSNKSKKRGAFHQFSTVPVFFFFLLCFSVSMTGQDLSLADFSSPDIHKSHMQNNSDVTLAVNELSTSVAVFNANDSKSNINKYISDNLEFPETAVQTGTYGILKVNFEILPDGTVENIVVMESPGTDFEAAAIEMIEDMPRWKPAYRDGVAVKSSYKLNLKFRLQ